MVHIFVGIDPGQGGGIAFVYPPGSTPRCVAHRMPETDRDLLDLLGRREPVDVFCYHAMIEKVGPTPQMGRTSAFVFGKGLGRLLMALAAAGMPYDEVSPVRWQTALGCRSGGDKNITKARAQALFPNTKVTHAIADALLIAEYARRVHAGELAPTPQATMPGKRHPLSERKQRAMVLAETDAF